MSAPVNLNLDFVDFSAMDVESGRVRAILVKIENDLERELEELFIEHAEIVKALAKTYVRVDTGSLQKSIRVERVVASGKNKHVAVRAGGYIVNPKTKRLVDYAGYVEQKYPYLQIAYEHVLPMLDQAIINLMRRLTT